jgi:Flp pilus assembly CpaF family ATPase
MFRPPAGYELAGAAMSPLDTLARQIREEVALQLAERAKGNGRAPLRSLDQQLLGRQLINDALERHARRCLASGTAVIDEETEAAVARAAFDLLFALGRLQPLLDDERVENIVINGCDQVWLEYEDGTKAAGPPVAANDDELIEMIREIGRRHGLSERQFDPTHPTLNLPLPDGSRLFAIAWVCARPSVAIRRHRFLKLTLDDLMGRGTVDLALRNFLGAAVRARLQILVCGATGVGKTTMLRALAAEIPPDERLVTIETELELGLDRFPELHQDVVALEAREANVEGVGEMTAAELVRSSLRMNPGRVIVGEVRGAEVVPMLNAMSQGNEGSMCTLHADSSEGAFARLAGYAIQAPERLPIEGTNLVAASAIDLVVFMVRRGSRFVSSVREVVGASGVDVITNEVFRPGADGRAVPGIPLRARTLASLVAEGFDPSLLSRPEGWWS